MTFSFASIDISVFDLTSTSHFEKYDDKRKEIRRKETLVCSIAMNVLFLSVCDADWIELMSFYDMINCLLNRDLPWPCAEDRVIFFFLPRICLYTLSGRQLIW